MYNSSYSRAKFGLEAKDIQRSKGKSCGYYMRIVFFFSSLIQSLIIVSLVLFLVYGKSEQSAEQQRVQDLEQSFERLSKDIQLLRQQKAEVTMKLNKNVAEKVALEKELATTKDLANTTAKQLDDLRKQVTQCETDKKKAEMTRSTPIQCPGSLTTVNAANNEVRSMHLRNQHMEAMVKQMQTNFTQTVLQLNTDLDSAIKARQMLHLEAIELRQDKVNLKEQLEKYAVKCREDFVQSLEGIPAVTKAFLKRIENLFPQAFTFHLTCYKQQEQMERIRESCSSLSREIEDKFQQYLNNVGSRIAEIQAQNSLLLVQNRRAIEAYQLCRQASAQKPAGLLSGSPVQQQQDRLNAPSGQVSAPLTNAPAVSRAAELKKPGKEP
ncbi:plasmalemma vesicle associated protein b [Conger conger]|uniref:plasmalemma vesicle associated protein b n=1 Tax=Conger conger TaxID=82655 RepID=UPI002A5A9607|nr:plasmalemma vesicle associated protein b [Conger conger]